MFRRLGIIMITERINKQTETRGDYAKHKSIQKNYAPLIEIFDAEEICIK